MRTVISTTVLKAHPNLDTILWRTACIAKEYDNDIMINGLLVRVTKSPTVYWSGVAHPLEQTMLYHQKLIHPAGRVDLRLTLRMTPRSVAVLFSHELRHIGAFHRGRKKYGVLSDSGYIYEVEKDCTEFEKQIADEVMRGTKIYRGIE